MHLVSFDALSIHIQASHNFVDSICEKYI